MREASGTMRSGGGRGCGVWTSSGLQQRKCIVNWHLSAALFLSTARPLPTTSNHRYHQVAAWQLHLSLLTAAPSVILDLSICLFLPHLVPPLLQHDLQQAVASSLGLIQTRAGILHPAALPPQNSPVRSRLSSQLHMHDFQLSFR